MRKTRIVGLVAAPLMVVPGMLALATPVSADKPSPDGVDVIAHRGSSGVAPENTAAAVKTAIKQRADFVEIDVQRTKDGRLVNFHDCTMERTTDVEEKFPDRSRYRVSDFTWQELQQLDAGSWFDEDYAGEKIISVRDVIEQVERKTGLLAEISPCDHHDGLPAALDELLRTTPDYVEEALAEDQFAVQTFEIDDARAFHELRPEVPIGLLDAERPTDAELVELSRWADQVNPRHTVTDRALVDRIHELGMQTNVWTVAEPGTMRTMVDLGVDGIITDYPQSLTQR